MIPGSSTWGVVMLPRRGGGSLLRLWRGSAASAGPGSLGMKTWSTQSSTSSIPTLTKQPLVCYLSVSGEIPMPNFKPFPFPCSAELLPLRAQESQSQACPSHSSSSSRAAKGRQPPCCCSARNCRHCLSETQGMSFVNLHLPHPLATAADLICCVVYQFLCWAHTFCMQKTELCRHYLHRATKSSGGSRPGPAPDSSTQREGAFLNVQHTAPPACSMDLEWALPLQRWMPRNNCSKGSLGMQNLL